MSVRAPSMPVSVLLRRRLVSGGRWTVPQWELAEVLCAAEAAAAGRRPTVVGEGEDGGLEVLWTGLRVELYRDACEGYWVNLMSARPRLFVCCAPDEEAGRGPEEMEPTVVTANQEEAVAHMESEDEVYSAPMPAAMIEWVERFVVEHYVPVHKKKRKRDDWREEGGAGAGRRRGPGARG